MHPKIEKLGKIDSLAKFYEMIDILKKARQRIFSRYPDISKKDVYLLKSSLEVLESIPKSRKRFILDSGEGKTVKMDLSYEIGELKKDIVFLEQGDELFLKYLSRLHKSFDKELSSLKKALSGKRFNLFITDRDGTVNNYCGRYMTSVQSIYNAIFLKDFLDNKAEKGIIITSAPLEGILGMSLLGSESVIYAGSKGREYVAGGRKKTKRITPKKKALLNDLSSRIKEILSKKEFEKFSLIGSGYQEKFGQLTIARQDISGSIDESESRAFMDRLRTVVKKLDPEGKNLGIEDTGLDIEITLTVEDMAGEGKERAFDKGDGVRFISDKLSFNLDAGPNLVCGDTGSDVAMAQKILEISKRNIIVFVSKDIKLKNKIRKLTSDHVFVSSPDVLVAALFLSSKKR